MNNDLLFSVLSLACLRPLSFNDIPSCDCVGQNCFLDPLPKSSENGHSSESCVDNTKPISVRPVPLKDIDLPKDVSASLSSCASLCYVNVVLYAVYFMIIWCASNVGPSYFKV